MALWQGTTNQTEQDSLAGQKPREAYFMLDPGGSGRYVIGVGNKPAEAAAFLKFAPIASAPGRYVLDTDPNEEDRKMYLIGANRVVV